MTFPAILSATESIWPALAAFVGAIALAFFGASLLMVSVGACLIVILLDLFM
jgi:hypothetical protein